MRPIIVAALFSAMISVPFVAKAQSTPPQHVIERAFMSPPAQAQPQAPAPTQSGLTVTPAMLRGDLRGIVLSHSTTKTPTRATTHGGQPQPMPTTAASQPEGCAAYSNSCSISVMFQTGSATLTPEAAQILNEVGSVITEPRFAPDRFGVIGHTDTVGSDAFNLSLSEQRAQAVAAYLESHFNIASTRLEASGVGKRDLLVQTPDQTPNASNRRVQFVKLKS